MLHVRCKPQTVQYMLIPSVTARNLMPYLLFAYAVLSHARRLLHSVLTGVGTMR